MYKTFGKIIYIAFSFLSNILHSKKIQLIQANAWIGLVWDSNQYKSVFLSAPLHSSEYSKLLLIDLVNYRRENIGVSVNKMCF